MENMGQNPIDYQRILNFSLDLICIAGMDGYFKYLNPAWEKNLGYTRDELLSRPFLDFIHPDDHAKNDEEVAKLAAGYQTFHFENRYIHKDGSIRHISWTAQPVADEKALYCTGRDITGRKQAEEALRESEEKYRLLVESTNDWVWACDIEGRQTFANQAIKTILGYEVHEIEGLSYENLLHPEDRRKIRNWLKNAIENKTGWEKYVLRWQHNDGTIRFLESTAQPILDGEGNMTGLTGIDRDITERKHAEEALQESEERFRTAFENAATGMALMANDGYFMSVNQTLCKILGYSEEELLSKTWVEITEPDDLAGCFDWLKRIKAGDGSAYEKRFIHKLGHQVWILVSSSLVRDSQGKIRYYISLFQDVMSRKQAEDKLKKRVKELNCFYSMAALLELPGISLDKILKRTVMLIPPAWQFPEITAARIVLDEQSFQTKNFRETPWMHAHEIILHGKPVGQVEVCYLEERQAIDEGPFMIEERHLLSTIAERLGKIIERMKAEEALKISRENLLEESEQRKILSKKLIDLLEKDRHDIAMELHDNIGQILTSLKINLEIVDDKLKPIDTELGSLIKVAEKRANQAITGINNIAHGLMPSIINALGLVSSLRALLIEFREHTDLKIDFFNRNVPKRFDQEKEIAIYRIVQEALNNIIKHAEAKNVYVSLLKKGNVLSLSVEDDGVGFDQDKAMKISKGKGPLGLVIMRERAMQLDGELTIESKIGKGTHLWAEIPI